MKQREKELGKRRVKMSFNDNCEEVDFGQVLTLLRTTGRLRPKAFIVAGKCLPSQKDALFLLDDL